MLLSGMFRLVPKCTEIRFWQGRSGKVPRGSWRVSFCAVGLGARTSRGHARSGSKKCVASTVRRCRPLVGRGLVGRLVVGVVASAFMVYVRTIPYKDCAVAFLVLPCHICRRPPKRHCPRHASLLSLIDSPAGCSGRGRACGSTRIVPYPREPAPAPRVNQKNNDDLPQSFSSAQGHRQYQ